MTDKMVSDKIWDNIKNLAIEMFAIPGQKVHMHFKKLNGGSPSDLYLKAKSSAALPSLEAALDFYLPEKYVVRNAEQYIVVTEVEQDIPIEELTEEKKIRSGLVRRS
jgi:hypothetical protein